MRVGEKRRGVGGRDRRASLLLENSGDVLPFASRLHVGAEEILPRRRASARGPGVPA